MRLMQRWLRLFTRIPNLYQLYLLSHIAQQQAHNRVMYGTRYERNGNHHRVWTEAKTDDK
jgi:hypothetical protein